jgi:hypothetical protein
MEYGLILPFYINVDWEGVKMTTDGFSNQILINSTYISLHVLGG